MTLFGRMIDRSLKRTSDRLERDDDQWAKRTKDVARRDVSFAVIGKQTRAIGHWRNVSSIRQQTEKKKTTNESNRIASPTMMSDEISATNGSTFPETTFPAREPLGNAGEDDENWFYERPRADENR